MGILLIDIGGTKCSFHLDNVEEVNTLKTSDFGHPQEIMEFISEATKKQGFSVSAVGVSFGGQFDFDNQKVYKSVHKSGWDQFSFSDWAGRKFGVAAVADNDANCGALGEWKVRNKPQNLVYVTISTGVGSGLILNGEIYRGSKNFAGEIGHIQIDPNGEPDELGNLGTLERACGGYWLSKDFGKSTKELFEDEEFFQNYVADLCKGLSVILKLLAPDFLVLGGGTTNYGSRVGQEVNRRLAAERKLTETKIEISQLGGKNVLIGARELVRSELHH